MWNTPNLLTLLRIGLIPVFVGIFYLPEDFYGKAVKVYHRKPKNPVDFENMLMYDGMILRVGFGGKILTWSKTYATMIHKSVPKLKGEKMNKTETIMNELDGAGYDSAVAIATDAEIKAGAACGQLAIIAEDD